MVELSLIFSIIPYPESVLNIVVYFCLFETHLYSTGYTIL